MSLGQWLGLTIMAAMCGGLMVWLVYVVKKESKEKE